MFDEISKFSMADDADDYDEYEEEFIERDEEYDDGEEEYEDEEYDDEEYEDDYDDEEEYEDDYELPARSRSSHSSSNKVTPMRQPARRNNGVSMEVCVIKPNSVEDAREITETLLSGRTVILNLEGLDLEIAQRIIDFTSGATYAISGNLQKISNYIFLVTPTNVDISGDLQDLLNTSFDASSMRSRF